MGAPGHRTFPRRHRQMASVASQRHEARRTGLCAMTAMVTVFQARSQLPPLTRKDVGWQTPIAGADGSSLVGSPPGERFILLTPELAPPIAVGW